MEPNILLISQSKFNVELFTKALLKAPNIKAISNDKDAIKMYTEYYV